jgi:hypothetical protein
VVFENSGLDDRVYRASLLAKSTVNAFEQINVIARGPARTVVRDITFNGNRGCRAYRLTQFAGDTAFFAVRVPPLGMQAPETR